MFSMLKAFLLALQLLALGRAQEATTEAEPAAAAAVSYTHLTLPTKA